MFRKLSNSLIARLILISVLMISLTLSVTGAAIVWTFEKSVERMLENHLAAYTDLLISHVTVKNGQVLLRQNKEVLSDIPRYWQITSGSTKLFRSYRLKQWITPLPEDLHKTQRLELQNGDGVEIVAVQSTFLFPEDRRITLIFGLDRQIADAYRIEERERLRTPLIRILSLAALVLLLFNAAMLAWVIRPARQVKQAVQAVRDGRAKRIEGRYPSEIAALSDEINHLLDYASGMLSRHREFSANLAHALKTPLTVIRNESDPAIIKAKVDNMLQLIDRNLARVQESAMPDLLAASTLLLPIIEEIAGSFARLHDRQTRITVPGDIFFRGSREDLYEILGNLIENACKFAHSEIVISYDGECLMIEDDGPGIPETERQHVLRRGARLDETVKGSGIGLTIATELLALYGGHLQLSKSIMLGGLKVTVFLPFQR